MNWCQRTGTTLTVRKWTPLSWSKTRTKIQKSPRLAVPRKASPGAFKYLLFSSICYSCCNLFIYAFKFTGVDWNLWCMILGSYMAFILRITRLDALLTRTGKSRVVPATREIIGSDCFITCCNHKAYGGIMGTRRFNDNVLRPQCVVALLSIWTY